MALGTSTPKILFGHILPNTVAPLIVQGTYICALRHPAGGDPLVPRRRLAARHPDLGQHHGRGPGAVRRGIRTTSFSRGVFLAVTVLAVNMLGDGLRDTLDPKMAQGRAITRGPCGPSRICV